MKLSEVIAVQEVVQIPPEILRKAEEQCEILLHERMMDGQGELPTDFLVRCSAGIVAHQFESVYSAVILLLSDKGSLAPEQRESWVKAHKTDIDEANFEVRAIHQHMTRHLARLQRLAAALGVW